MQEDNIDKISIFDDETSKNNAVAVLKEQLKEANKDSNVAVIQSYL